MTSAPPSIAGKRLSAASSRMRVSLCTGVEITVGSMRVDVMTFPKPLAAMGAAARGRTQSGRIRRDAAHRGRPHGLHRRHRGGARVRPASRLSTGVAVAFPRSPMITAQAAWELQELTGGRFRLGLGTQVRTHVVRRYGVEFEHPGPRLRDYVRAVKACFAGFRGEPLDHHGEFYELDVPQPPVEPGPDRRRPTRRSTSLPSTRGCCAMAGEVADGVHVHPIGEPGYLARHVVPSVCRGRHPCRPAATRATSP